MPRAPSKTKRRSTAAPAPAPALDVPLLTRRFNWTPEAAAAAEKREAHVRSIYGGPVLTSAEITERLTRSFSALATSAAWRSADWSPECAARRDKVASTWGKGQAPGKFDPVQEAVTLALADVDEQGTVVASWLQGGGVGGALRALAAVWSFDAKRDVLTETDPALRWEGTYNGGANAVRMLRIHFSTLTGPEKAEAVGVGNEARAKAPLTVRVRLSLVVRHREWVDQDADDLMALGTTPWPFDALSLVNDLCDADRIGRFVDQFRLLDDLDELEPYELVKGAELEAQAVMTRCVVKARNRDQAIHAAVYLTALETVETAQAFVEVMTKKGLTPIAHDFFARRPDLALAALTSSVANGGKLAVVAEPIARKLIEDHRELARALRPLLDAKAARALDTMSA